MGAGEGKHWSKGTYPAIGNSLGSSFTGAFPVPLRRERGCFCWISPRGPGGQLPPTGVIPMLHCDLTLKIESPPRLITVTTDKVLR